MFKVGDKVASMKYYHSFDGESLEYGEIYTVRYTSYQYVMLDNYNNLHDMSDFISMKEYRKLKIKELNAKAIL